VRVAAFELLRRFPRGALPGLTTAASVAHLVRWALSHLGSPRACESDAAAYVLRLVWQRYVLQLGWRVTLPSSASADARASVTVSPAAAAAPTEAVVEGAGEGEAATAEVAAEVAAEERVVESVALLVAGLEAMLAGRMATRPREADGPRDADGPREAEPHAAPERASLHGPLVALRLLLADLEPLIAPGRPVWRRRLWRARLRVWLPRLLAQCTAVSRRALEVIADPVVASGWKTGPKAAVAADAVEGARPGAQAADSPAGVPSTLVADWLCSAEGEGGATLPSKTVGLSELMVTMCWLVIKEASLLVGQACTLALPPPPPRKHAARPAATPAPAPAAAAAAAAPAADNDDDNDGGGGDGDGDGDDDDAPLLSAAELDAAGRALIGTLLSTRHSGAIEKAAAGLGMLADRLLGCGQPERAALPRAWCAALLR